MYIQTAAHYLVTPGATYLQKEKELIDSDNTCSCNFIKQGKPREKKMANLHLKKIRAQTNNY